MIKLIFTFNRELLHFAVKDKVISYTDRRWNRWLQCMPKDEEFIKKIKASRNVFPEFLTKLFNFTEEELKEYDACKDDNALADKIILDAKLRGCKLLAKTEVENANT